MRYLADENEQVGDEVAGTVQMSLVMGGLKLGSDFTDANGSRIISCKKPGGGGDDDEEDWDTSSDEGDD